MRRLELAEIQRTEFEIMSAVIDFFDKNAIRYFTSGGTTLGSVRHQGFIPWDDDIDLFLPRKDYDRMLELTDGILLDGYITFKKPGDRDYIYPFAKACSEKTLVYEQNVSDKKYALGVFIDLFPLDNFYNNTAFNYLLYVRSKLLESMLETSTNQVNLSREDSFKYHAKNFLRALQRPIAKKLSPEYITKRIDSIGRKTQKINSKYVGNIVWGFHLMYFEKRLFEAPVKGFFEGKEVNNPVCWNEYLTKMYGDYMTLPPVEKRASHCMEAYYINE